MKPPTLPIILLPALVAAFAYQYTRQATHPRTCSNQSALRDALKNPSLEEINPEELKLRFNSTSAPDIPGRPVGDSGQTQPGSSQNITSLGDWAGCEDPDHAYFPIAQENGELKLQCRPDTLYTWVGAIRIGILEENMLADTITDENSERPIFTHINPIATFAYGNMQIRIKLKKDTKFLFSTEWPLCANMTNKQKKTTVIIRYYGKNNGKEAWAGVDYVLCSMGPVHSWSIGTRQAYDEMLAALEWINKYPPDWSSIKTAYEPANNWLPYIKFDWSSSFHHDGIQWDHKDWSPEHLRLNINIARQMSEQHLDNKIYYARDVAPDENAHFASSHKTYWNSKIRP